MSLFVDLMREMQEIESQRNVVPPVPASKVKDHINNDAWALQYLEDGKSFAVGCHGQSFVCLFVIFVLWCLGSH